jgi:hypothetical protein
MEPYQPPWLMLIVENTSGILENAPADIMADNKVILRNITVRSVTNYAPTQIGVRFEMTKEQADTLRQAKSPFRLVAGTNVQ